MDDYVQYHNSDTMGELSHSERSGFGVSTNKSVSKLMGSRIWLISGTGKPRKYHLCYYFFVDTIEPLDRISDFKFSLNGEQGKSFERAILISDFPWFKGFLKSQQNFSMGLRKIEVVFVDKLEKVVSDHEVQNLGIDEQIQKTSVGFDNSETNQKDELALARIESLTVNEYKAAFTVTREQMAESDLFMLKAHYESPNYDITATQLASKVGFPSFTTANLRYGLLAGRLLQFFQIQFESYVNINALTYLDNLNGEWHWILRPQVIQALHELKWFGDAQNSNVLQEIEQFQSSYAALPETTRESIIQSRIGQGQFRASLVKYWRGCSVSGCDQIELLRASHIKPWRDSSNAERLDLYNGLLLLPNLDACFDVGLIGFDDDGKILISNKLSEAVLLELGINSSLKLLRIEKRHGEFLRFHRENIFRS
jgi:hypothetical protein